MASIEVVTPADSPDLNEPSQIVNDPQSVESLEDFDADQARALEAEVVDGT